MRNLKKILALVLALMMVLSVMVTASASDFTDAEKIQYTEAVEVMSDLGILNGIADGDEFKFDPTGTLDRASAAKIIAIILNGGDLAANQTAGLDAAFTDASWASNYINYIASKGIVDGNGAGKYYPKNTLTGYEFAKMLLNAMGIEGEYTGDHWKMNVAVAADAADLTDVLGSDFLFKNNITREQAAQMAFNAMTYATEVEVGYPVLLTVTDGGESETFVVDTYPTLVDAAAAVTVLNTNAPAGYAYSYDIDVMEVPTKSLGLQGFGLRAQITTSGIGYNGYFWYVDTYANGSYTNGYDTKLTDFICTDTVVGTYTKANSYADISADLGLTYGDYLTASVYVNGEETTPVTVAFNDTTKVSTDSSSTVTVVITADYDVNFLYCNEVVATASSVKLTNKLNPY